MDYQVEFLKMKKAVCLLLDHAVHDFEQNDDCKFAVDYALDCLRGHPNENTVSAMTKDK